MPIITIARQLGTHGDEIGRQVAALLSYPCVSKDQLSVEAERYGLLQPEFAKLGEKRPGFLDRLFRERQITFLDLIQSLMYDHALAGSFVLIGMGGQIVLRDLGNVLHAAFIAPLALRVQRVAAREHVSEEIAQDLVQRSDRDRTGYMRYLFDAEWLDPLHYDLVLNTGKLDDDTCLELLKRAASMPRLSEGDAESRALVAKLATRARVKARLIGNEQVNARYVSVTCPEPGVVVLTGRVNSDEEKELAGQIAASVEGVREVQNELTVMIITPAESFYG